MTILPKLDVSDVSNHIIDWMHKTALEQNFHRVVIGVSGGIDSSVSLFLSVKAFGEKNVFPILLPCGQLGKKGEELGRLICQNVSIPQENITRIDIHPLVSRFISYDTQMDHVRRGNIMARLRMILLFDMAKKQNALVMGTENKSEHVLGYFTRFGDGASDIEPLIDLYKTHVVQLASFLHIPKEILESIPSAGLWKDQTDEEEFGFTYKKADQVLYLAYDKKKSKEEIVSMGFSRRSIENILDRAEKNTFKLKAPFSFFLH